MNADADRSIALTARVYTRPGCHLCDDAKQLLVEHGLTVEEINIDDDADLRARYGTCIPVVFIGGRERFRGRIKEMLLKRLLRRT